MVDARAKGLERRAVAAKFVCDNNAWLAEMLEEFAKKPIRSLRITSRLDENVQNITVAVDGAPQPMFLAADHDNNFVEMPLVRRLRAVSPYCFAISATEFDDPGSDGLVTHCVTPLSEKILDITQTKRKPEIRPYGISDHIGRKSVALELKAPDCLGLVMV